MDRSRITYRAEFVKDLRTMVGALEKKKPMASSEAGALEEKTKHLIGNRKPNKSERAGPVTTETPALDYASTVNTKDSKSSPDHKLNRGKTASSNKPGVSEGKGKGIPSSHESGSGVVAESRTDRKPDEDHKAVPKPTVPTEHLTTHNPLIASAKDRKPDHGKDVQERSGSNEYSTSAPTQPQISVTAITDYQIGWICALPFETAAAEVMLDERYPDIPRDSHASTLYTLGRIGSHNVVIACLPRGRPGTSAASVVASEMRQKFRGIRFGFMVGIGGGVPSHRDDIRLGDVVVSQPNFEHGGVVQYDFGKAEEGGRFRRTGHLNNPPTFLLSVLNRVQINHERGRRTYPIHMTRFVEEDMEEYTVPQDERDILFRVTYSHPAGTLACTTCDSNQIIRRPDRNTKSTNVKIHYGTIASGNQVIKDAQTRDRIVKDLGGQILCFEMEAAGLMNDFPCLVVRGISDYCDSHKNDGWQRYAAASAAAYTRELLLLIPPEDVVK
jgi:nucleoside phosphorylase